MGLLRRRRRAKLRMVKAVPTRITVDCSGTTPLVEYCVPDCDEKSEPIAGLPFKSVGFSPVRTNELENCAIPDRIPTAQFSGKLEISCREAEVLLSALSDYSENF